MALILFRSGGKDVIINTQKIVSIFTSPDDANDVKIQLDDGSFFLIDETLEKVRGRLGINDPFKIAKELEEDEKRRK